MHQRKRGTSTKLYWLNWWNQGVNVSTGRWKCDSEGMLQWKKRAQYLTYIKITTPDGLIMYLFGPEIGRSHDMIMYTESGLDKLLQGALVIEHQQYYWYGHSAFILRPGTNIPFQRALEIIQETCTLKGISVTLVRVEWIYKDVKQKFTTNEFLRMTKVRT